MSETNPSFSASPGARSKPHRPPRRRGSGGSARGSSRNNNGRFDELLEKQHYVHSARPGGRQLRHVPEVEGRWVAPIAFSGAAPHVQGRDRKIGWTPRPRVRWLHRVVNNSRFLVLVDRGQHPNPPSRVPALCLKRLSCHGQPSCSAR